MSRKLISERLQIPHIRANFHLFCSDVFHGVRSLFSWAPEQVYQRLGIVVLVQHFNQCPHPMQQCWCSLHDQGDKAVASELVAKKAVDGEIGEAWPILQGLEDEGSGQAFATHFLPTFFRWSISEKSNDSATSITRMFRWQGNVDVVCTYVLFYKCNYVLQKDKVSHEFSERNGMGFKALHRTAFGYFHDPWRPNRPSLTSIPFVGFLWLSILTAAAW